MRRTEDVGLAPCEPSDATHVWLNMPGPLSDRLIPVMLTGTRRRAGKWSWNGDVDRPTLKPSILTDTGVCKCHSFVTDGRAKFLDDCSHELAGKAVDLNDVEM